MKEAFFMTRVKKDLPSTTYQLQGPANILTPKSECLSKPNGRGGCSGTYHVLDKLPKGAFVTVDNSEKAVILNDGRKLIPVLFSHKGEEGHGYIDSGALKRPINIIKGIEAYWGCERNSSEARQFLFHPEF
jgi:hypothetical protein